MTEYDVAIIGAGSAGLSARREVEKKTQNYVVIDDGPMGTTCARVGCMPSKVLIQAANDFHRRHKLAALGVEGAEALTINHRKVMEHVRKLRDRFVRGVTQSIEPWVEQHLIKKRARFIDQNTLDLGDEKIKAKNIIVATGSAPVVPGSWRKYQKYLIDTDSFFELEDLPKKIAIIGLGVIGIELGQALSRLGVEVIGFSSGKSIGGLTDPELQEYTAKTMESEFKIYYGRSELVGEKDSRLQVKSGDKVIEVDKAFVTVGRSPLITKMNVEALGLKLNEKSLPEISKTNFNIKGTRIFMAGDSTGDRAILHEAADEGRIAGYNSVREEIQCFRRREFLAVTFSDPNIAIIGKSYRQLKEENIDFATGSVSFEGQGRAIVMLKEKGLLKVYGDKATGKLLGAELIAPSGEHLAHLLSWAINLNLSAHEVLSLPFYHPVIEEGLRTAIRDLSRHLEQKAPALETLRCQDAPAGTSC